ncbi:MAG TPA: type II secretion system protein GspM [Deltaproteobacteria bacterium]|nr:type II secretion system protein GspM [Deltaproteobacteria bacterium]
MQKIDRFMNLSKREKMILLGGGIFVAVFLLVAGLIVPLSDYRSDMKTAIRSKDTQLRSVHELSAGIKAAEAASRTSRKADDKGFSLFGFLEELASRSGVNDRIEYMKPISDTAELSRESVEVKIRGIYQEDLISLLYGIENCPTPLRIKRLNIRRVERENNLDVTFQVVHYG